MDFLTLLSILIYADFVGNDVTTSKPKHQELKPEPEPKPVTQDQDQFYRSIAGHDLYVFNPNCKPVEELPTIYGYNNGGYTGRTNGVLLAEDGHCIGSYIVPHESYILGDLCLFGDEHHGRLRACKNHYPDGFRFAFVGYADAKIGNCYGLKASMQKWLLVHGNAYGSA